MLKFFKRCKDVRQPLSYEPGDAPKPRCVLRAGHKGDHSSAFGWTWGLTPISTRG